MNRAMGFGVAGGMIAGTLFGASPASAHDQTVDSPYGKVAVTENHTVLVVSDYACGDGVRVRGDYYKYGVSGMQTVAPDCGTTAVIDTGRGNPVWAFRKCTYDRGTCGPWQYH